MSVHQVNAVEADCIMCGEPTTRRTTERVTGQELVVPCHARCERKAIRNHIYGLMA